MHLPIGDTTRYSSNMELLRRIDSTLAEVKDKVTSAVDDFKARAGDDAWKEVERLCEQAHEEALAGKAPRHAELAWIPTLLGKREHLGHSLKEEAYVEKDGQLVGIERFEALDPRWSLAMVEYLKNRDNKVPFGDKPAHIELAARTKLAVAGDWGTGYWRGEASPSYRVAEALRCPEAPPDWTIHLGDVYYAGTESEEGENLTQIWPKGRDGVLLLNSNHEMYSGGFPLFQQAMPKLAPQQNQTSYWSAANDDWFLLGLDTAYEATDIYLDGNLGSDNAQTRWLQAISAKIGSRKLIVLSHHEPVPFDGSGPTTVYSQVTGLLGRTPDFWYWGHLHNVIVYKNLPGGFQGRCVGHGAIPYGNARGLEGNSLIEWYETENANDPDYKQRVLNGYIELVLDGPSLEERLIGENGEQRWPKPKQA